MGLECIETVASRLERQFRSGPSTSCRGKRQVSCGLRFVIGPIEFRHADLRISLREMRTRQRNPGALQRLDGDKMPPLWRRDAGEKVFHLRLQFSRESRQPGTRQSGFLRQKRRLRLRARQAAPALTGEKAEILKPDAPYHARLRFCLSAFQFFSFFLHHVIHAHPVHQKMIWQFRLLDVSGPGADLRAELDVFRLL
jgi:hypothetical protein